MKEFVKLNKLKLKFVFFSTSTIFTILTLIIFAVGYLNQQIPELSLFIGVIFGAGIGMPLFILFIATIRGIWDLRKRRKAFGHKPFSELLNQGFTEKLKKEKNRWQFSEPVLLGNIESYQILAEVDTQHAPEVIRFQVLTKVETIGRDEMKRFTRKFSPDDIELDTEGVTKKISIKNHGLKTIDELMRELTRFTHAIEKENFKPVTNEFIMV